MLASEYTCDRKHTKFQPTDEQWKCPKCGRGSDVFYMSDDSIDCYCPLLHDDDYIVCENCEREWTGKKLAAVMAKNAGLVKCPHCKGSGFVKEETE